MPLQSPAIHGAAGAGEAGRDPGEPGLDPGDEPCVDRLLLLAPLDRPDQDERLGPVRPRTRLRLHPCPHGGPVLRLGEDPRPLAELPLGRPHHVTPARLLEPGEIGRAHHAAVHHPDALGHPEAGLHGGDDLLHRGDISPVAREDLVPQGQPRAGDDEREAHLLAVRPVVAAVAPLREGVGHGVPFEVGARHVVEEEVIVHLEEFAEAGDEVRLQCGLVGQEVIQGAVAAVVVHQGHGHPEEILQGGLPIPNLGEVELAGWLAEARQDQHRGHRRPGDGLPARGQEALQQAIELQRPPHGPAEPDIAEGAAAFQAHAVQADGHGLVEGGKGVKEISLRPAPGERGGQGPRANPALRIELPEVGDGLLANSLPHPDRAHELPVRVDLPILAPGRVTEIRDAAGRRQWGRSPLHGDSGRGALTGHGVTRADQGNFPSVRGAVRKLG